MYRSCSTVLRIRLDRQSLNLASLASATHSRHHLPLLRHPATMSSSTSSSSSSTEPSTSASPSSSSSSSSSKQYSPPEDLPVPSTPAMLNAKIDLCLALARSVGVLSSIQADIQRRQSGAVNFILCLAKQLEKKPKGSGDGPKKNPFLPPFDEGLFVSHLSPLHSLIFNRFNLVEKHVIVITRQFVQQGAPLTKDDVSATAKTIVAIDGLGFYNCGSKSGASQPHKHMQVFPRTTDGLCNVPLDEALESAALPSGPGVGRLPFYRFEHRFSHLPPVEGVAADKSWDELEVEQWAEKVHGIYCAMLEQLHVRPDHAPDEHSYNVLLTTRWLLVVPRQSDAVDGVSLNSVCFGGSLFVRNAAELAVVDKRGVLGMLAGATFPIVEGVQ